MTSLVERLRTLADEARHDDADFLFKKDILLIEEAATLITDLLADVRALQSAQSEAIRTARTEALEEAAKEAERPVILDAMAGRTGARGEGRVIAASIRALSSPTGKGNEMSDTTCAAGEPIGWGPCKRCGATMDEGCHVNNARILNAHDDLVRLLSWCVDTLRARSPELLALHPEGSQAVALLATLTSPPQKAEVR